MCVCVCVFPVITTNDPFANLLSLFMGGFALGLCLSDNQWPVQPLYFPVNI